jgi:carbon-monoxide dehydrogenase medium subunit
MPPTSIGLGATLELVNAAGEARTLSAESFLKGPLETARSDDEILVAVVLPPAPKRAGSAYRKWGLVTDALPVVGVCAYLELDGDACRRARIAVGGLASGPRRAGAAEQALLGAGAEAERIDAAAAAAAAEIDAQSDLWASSDYRKELIRSLARDVIARAAARAREK